VASRTAAGTVRYVKESLVAGDDMVPAVSLMATFAGDPRIRVRAWGNGRPREGLDWVSTEHGVRHADLLGNPDVLTFLLRRPDHTWTDAHQCLDRSSILRVDSPVACED